MGKITLSWAFIALGIFLNVASQSWAEMNLDCSSTFMEDAQISPNLFDVVSSLDDDMQKIEMQRAGTARTEFTLYYAASSLSTVLGIQELVGSKLTETNIRETKSQCNSDLIPFNNLLEIEDSVCSFHQDIWPPLNTKAMAGSIYQHVFSKFTQEQSISTQIGMHFEAVNPLVPEPLVWKPNSQGPDELYGHVLNVVPVWKSLKPLLQEIHQTLEEISKDFDTIQTFSGAEDILEIIGANGPVKISLTGSFSGSTQANFDRIHVPKIIWKGFTADNAGKCGGALAVYNCYGEICNNYQPIPECTMENCSSYFFHDFVNAGDMKYCCGSLSLMQQFLGDVDGFIDVNEHFNCCQQ